MHYDVGKELLKLPLQLYFRHLLSRLLPSALFQVQMNGRLFGGLSAADRKTSDLSPLLTHTDTAAAWIVSWL